LIFWKRQPVITTGLLLIVLMPGRLSFCVVWLLIFERPFLPGLFPAVVIDVPKDMAMGYIGFLRI
jgi:hypothetical protein